MDFLDEIARRVSVCETAVEEARERVRLASESLEKAKDELVVWRNAYRLALPESSDRPGEAAGHHPATTPVDVRLSKIVHDGENRAASLFAVADLKSKAGVLLAALRQHGSPMKTEELVTAVRPALARSTAYKAIKDLKKEGRIVSTEDRRLAVAEIEGASEEAPFAETGH